MKPIRSSFSLRLWVWMISSETTGEKKLCCSSVSSSCDELFRWCTLPYFPLHLHRNTQQVYDLWFYEVSEYQEDHEAEKHNHSFFRWQLLHYRQGHQRIGYFAGACIKISISVWLSQINNRQPCIRCNSNCDVCKIGSYVVIYGCKSTNVLLP